MQTQLAVPVANMDSDGQKDGDSKGSRSLVKKEGRASKFYASFVVDQSMKLAEKEEKNKEQTEQKESGEPAEPEAGSPSAAAASRSPFSSSSAVATVPAKQTEHPHFVLVQNRAFTRWVNFHIDPRQMSITTLEFDFGLGIHLLVLLEQLSGKKIPRVEKVLANKKRFLTSHFEKLQNNQIALEFIASENIELVAIGPEDLVTLNFKLTLGLVWTLILHYQLFLKAEEKKQRAALKKSKKKKKKQKKSTTDLRKTAASSAGGLKYELLAWTQKRVEPYEVTVENFTKDWMDGRAISALTDSLQPGLIPGVRELKAEEALDNTSRAIDAAEQKLGIRRLLEPEDLAGGEVPDEHSVMLYVSLFRDAYQKNKEEKRMQSEENEEALPTVKKVEKKEVKEEAEEDNDWEVRRRRMGEDEVTWEVRRKIEIEREVERDVKRQKGESEKTFERRKKSIFEEEVAKDVRRRRQMEEETCWDVRRKEEESEEACDVRRRKEIEEWVDRDLRRFSDETDEVFETRKRNVTEDEIAYDVRRRQRFEPEETWDVRRRPEELEEAFDARREATIEEEVSHDMRKLPKEKEESFDVRRRALLEEEKVMERRRRERMENDICLETRKRPEFEPEEAYDVRRRPGELEEAFDVRRYYAIEKEVARNVKRRKKNEDVEERKQAAVDQEFAWDVRRRAQLEREVMADLPREEEAAALEVRAKFYAEEEYAKEVKKFATMEWEESFDVKKKQIEKEEEMDQRRKKAAEQEVASDVRREEDEPEEDFETRKEELVAQQYAKLIREDAQINSDGDGDDDDDKMIDAEPEKEKEETTPKPPKREEHKGGKQVCEAKKQFRHPSSVLKVKASLPYKPYYPKAKLEVQVHVLKAAKEQQMGLISMAQSWVEIVPKKKKEVVRTPVKEEEIESFEAMLENGFVYELPDDLPMDSHSQYFLHVHITFKKKTSPLKIKLPFLVANKKEAKRIQKEIERQEAEERARREEELAKRALEPPPKLGTLGKFSFGKKKGKETLDAK
ncbi:Nicotinate phosphoribosyltransferase [Balamuthia mandrillaris]